MPIPLSMMIQIFIQNQLFHCIPSNEQLLDYLIKALENEDIDQYTNLLQYSNNADIEYDLYKNIPPSSIKRIVMNKQQQQLTNTELINKNILLGHLFCLHKQQSGIQTVIMSLTKKLICIWDKKQLSPTQIQIQNGQSDKIIKYINLLFNTQLIQQDSVLISKNNFKLAQIIYKSLFYYSKLSNNIQYQKHSEFYNSFKIYFQKFKNQDNMKIIIKLMVFTMEHAIIRSYYYRQFLKKSRKYKNSNHGQLIINASHIKLDMQVFNYYTSQIVKLINKHSIQYQMAFNIYSFFQNIHFIIKRKRIDNNKLQPIYQIIKNYRNQNNYEFLENLNYKEQYIIKSIIEEELFSNRFNYLDCGNYFKIIQFKPYPSQIYHLPNSEAYNILFKYTMIQYSVITILLTDFPEYQMKIIQSFLKQKYDQQQINALIIKYNTIISTLLFNEQVIQWNRKLTLLLFKIALNWIEDILTRQLQIFHHILIRMIKLVNLLSLFTKNQGYFCVDCLYGGDCIICRRCKKICRLVGQLQTNLQVHHIKNATNIMEYIREIKQKIQNQEDKISQYQYIISILTL